MPADLPPFSNLRKALTDLEHCLTCAYCSRIYTDPFTLTTCGHTFCEHCVLIFVSANKAQSLCPLCNIPIWLNQSHTNRQLKGLLQHYQQMRSLLEIEEPINIIPNYLKPKNDPKRRKGKKKNEKLFINPSRETIKSSNAEQCASPNSQSLVQTEDITLKEDTRSLASIESFQTTKNVDTTNNISPSDTTIIDNRQETIHKEAKSKSDLVEFSPGRLLLQGMITNVLTNSITKLCDDVIPTDSVIDNNKLTSTPANGELVRRDMFVPSSKSEILPRSINFFQLFDDGETSMFPENSLNRDSSVIQQVATSPLSRMEQKDSTLNTPSPVVQQIDTSINLLTQKHTPINLPDSQEPDSYLNTPSPVIQKIDTPINLPDSRKQDSYLYNQSPVIQQIDTSTISLTQKHTPTNLPDSQKQDSYLDNQSPLIQHSATSFDLLTQEHTLININPSKEKDSCLNTPSPIIQQIDTSVFPLTQNNSPDKLHNSEEQISILNNQSPVIQQNYTSINLLTQKHTPININTSHEQDFCHNTPSPVIQKIDTPINLPDSQKQDSYLDNQSPLIQHSATSFDLLTQEHTPININPSKEKDSCLNTPSPIIQQIDTSVFPLTQNNSPDKLHNSEEQISILNSPSSVIQQNYTSINLLTQKHTPININTSHEQDFCHNTPSPVIQKIDTPINLPDSQKQDSYLDNQSPVIQHSATSFDLLTQEHTLININPSKEKDSCLNTPSPVIQQIDTSTIPLTQNNTPNKLHNPEEQVSILNNQSSVIQQIDTSTIPLTQKHTPNEIHNSEEQISILNTPSPVIQHTVTSINRFTQENSPITINTSKEKDSCLNTPSTVIRKIDTSPINLLTQKHTPTDLPDSQKQDSCLDIQSPVIQQIDTSPINLLTQKHTPMNLYYPHEVSNFTTQSPVIHQQNDVSTVNLASPTGEFQPEECNSQSLDDSVIIESVQLASDHPTSNGVCDKTEDKLQSYTHTKPRSTKTIFPHEDDDTVYSTNMCLSQPLPYEHILQAQKNLRYIPQIQLLDPGIRYPSYNSMKKLPHFPTVYYYPHQVPIRPKTEFVPNHNPIRQAHDPIRQAHDPIRQAHNPIRQAHDPIRQAHDPIRQAHNPIRQAPPQVCGMTLPTNQFGYQNGSTLSTLNIGPNIPTNHFINPIQKKRDAQAAQHQLLQRDFELEQKRLDQIHESYGSNLPSPDSPQNIEQTSKIESENELSENDLNESIDPTLSKNEAIAKSDSSQDLKEDNEVCEKIQPKGNSISDCFLRKYSIQLSPFSYTQNSQINEVLSVVKDLSNKISRLDSDEDSNFSLSSQSPRFMRNNAMVKSPVNSVNRFPNSPVPKPYPDSEYAQRNFSSPRVSTMESYNSEMTIDSSLNIIDYADMSIDESLYKEKHFSPSLTSPIPSNHFKRRSNGFKSKKIKLSVGGIYNKPNKDSGSKSSRVLSPTKRNEINQLPKPQGRTRSRRSGYPQVN